jgi:nucleoside-diphosphate-sugar epimerase
MGICESIIVTGASSQVGKFLLPRLVEKGFTVNALGRTPPTGKEKGVVWHRVDIGKDPLPPIAAQCLIHLAPLPLLLPGFGDQWNRKRI